MKNILTLFVIFYFTSFSAFSQAPSNDDCSGAIAVPVSTSTTCTQFAQGNMTNATLSNNPFFATFVDKDVWFKFTASSKLHKINFSDFADVQGNNENMFIQIVDAGGNACNHNFNIGSATVTDTTGFVFDFNIGEDYVIRVSTVGNFGLGVPYGSFKVCVTTPISPDNITCDKVKTLTIPTNGTSLVLSENLVNVPYVFMNQFDCASSNPEKSLWYSFKATQNAYSIKIINAINQNQGVPLTSILRIYEGDSCFAQKLLYCNSSASFGNGYQSYQSDKFLPGKNYFVIVSSAYHSPMSFDMNIRGIQNSPVNDLCDKAIPLTINAFGSCASVTNGSTGNFSPSESPCGQSNELIGDVWYSFIATKKSHIISLSNKSPDDNLHFSLLTGTCGQLYQTGNCYETQKSEVKNLFVGEKYFVVVRNNLFDPAFQNHTFTLCVQDGTPPPPNDDLANASVLEVNPTLSPVKYKSGSLALASASNLNTCNGNNSSINDIFYTFVATNPQHLLQFTNIKFDNSNFSSLELAVLDDALADVACNPNIANDSTIFLNKLIVGKKYTLRMYSSVVYSFDLAVITPPSPPINDLCAAAITLTPSNDWSCKNPINGTNFWATTDDETSIYQGYGVWYSFTATSTKHNIYLENIVGISSNNLNIRLIVTKNPCDLDDAVYKNNLPNDPTSILSGLEIGKKYYINVQARDLKSFIFFDICITTPTGIFTNETCKTAINLTVNPSEKIIDFLPTSSNYAQYVPINPSNQDFYNLESIPTWYKFTALSTQQTIHFLDLETILGTTGADIKAEFYEGTCDSLVASKIVSITTVYTIATVIGKVYWVKIFHNSTGRAKFNLAITTGYAPLNDDCTGAFEVKISPNTKPIFSQITNFNFSTDSLGTVQGQDIWYSFTAQQKNHTLQLSSNAPNSPKPYVKIYKGLCNNLSFFKEYDLMNDTITVVNGLQNGEKYFVRLINRDIPLSRYKFAIGTPVILQNDEFADAISIVPTANCTNPIVFNTTWATPSPQQTCSNDKDIWYKFTAQKMLYLLALDNYTGNNSVKFSIFSKNANGDLEIIPNGCLDFNNSSNYVHWLQKLTIGEEYWISTSYNGTDDLRFCFLETQTPPANNEPNNAIVVTPNPSYACTNKTIGTANWATPNDDILTSNCQNSVKGDVWYKFTATKTKHYVRLTYSGIQKDTTLYLSLYQYDAATSKYTEQTCPSPNDIVNFTYEKNKQYFIKIAGNQYFTQKINFNLCINTQIEFEPPVNDDCENATLLTVKNAGVLDSTIYTTRLATAQNTNSICGFDKKDLWYKFVATDTIHSFNINTKSKIFLASYERLSFSLYESDDCPTFGATVCHGSDTEIIGGFKIGKTYYIRMLGDDINGFQTYFNFNFTIQKVNVFTPVNDVCSGAKNIPINTTIEIKTFLEASTLFAKKSPNVDSICNKKIKYHDLWYKFTASKANHILQIFNKNGSSEPFQGNSPLFADVYKGSCNGTFTSVNCTSNGIGFESIDLKNLNIGETYYIRVYNDQNAGYIFTNYRIAVSENSNIASDCNSAIPLVSKQIYENTMFTTPKKVSWIDFNTNVAAQNWYKFTAKSSGIVFNLTSIKTASNASNLNIALLKAPCADSGMTTLQVFSIDTNKEQIIPNLEKDSVYYIVFYDFEKENLSYQFYIEQATPNPINKVCQGAFTLPMNPSLSPIAIVKDSLDTRFEDPYQRRYYKFVATSTHHFIYLKTTKQKQFGLSVVPRNPSDNCNDDQSNIQLTYSDVPDYYQVSGLSPNTTYYFYAVNSDFDLDKKYYDVAVLTQNNIAINDLCNNSISLDAATTTSVKCATSIPVVLKNATATEELTPNLPYQWYDFTAKSKKHILKIRNYTESNTPLGTNLVFNLHTYNDCNSYVVSKSVGFDFTSSDSIDYILENLTIGQKYKITMARGGLYSVVTFDICLSSLPIPPPPPSNDLCQNAVSLTPSPTLTANTLVSGTAKNALIEPLPNSCHENSSHSVWYKFKAIAEKQVIVFQKPNNYNLYFDIFTGKCDSLAFVFCHYDSLVLLSNLKIGREYFIAVGTDLTDTLQDLQFKIAITTPTITNTNISCATASNLPVSPTTKVQQFVNGNFQYQNELWYKFIATAKSHRIHFVSLTPEIKNESANYTPISAGIGIGNGCINPSDTSILNYLTTYYFENLLDSTSNNNIINGLVIGKTYYLNFSESAGLPVGKNIPFKVGLTTVQSPNNQTPKTAQILPINAGKTLVNFYSENTQNLRITGSPDPFEVYGVLWYQFTATTKRHQILLENLQTDQGYYVTAFYNVDSSNDPFNPNIIFNGNFPNYNTGKNIMNNLTVGKKYIIGITLRKVKIQPDGTNISQINMTYRIGLITHPDVPNNDDCANAVQVPVNPTPICQQTVKGTTLFATNLYTFVPQNGNDDNVWYKFTATSERHFIQLKNIKPVLGDVIDMEYAVYSTSNNDCNFLFSIGNSSNRAYPLAPWKLEVGQTYYVEVYTRYFKDYSRCEFDLCVSTPIANDDFKGAILLANFTDNGVNTGFKTANGCTNALTASSLGATFSFDAGVPTGSCNIGTLPKDIWFKTVVGTKRNLAIQVLQSPVGADVQMVAYKVKNNVLSVIPGRCPSDTLLNLTQGDTIALRVWDGKGVAFGDYTLCIESFAKTTDVKNTVCTGITIHPVPTSDYLNFNVDYIEDATYKVNVTNASSGQIVLNQIFQKSTGMSSIDVRSLPSGNYVLKVFDTKKLFVKKFVKI